MIKIDDEKYIKFKHLLEYFVSHLEWCNNNDQNFVGYNQYIKSLVDTNNFYSAGQGYNGHNIQKQISEWSSYDNNHICINVYAANYKSNACYLNWEGSWINVRPQWNNNHIDSLYLSKEEKSSAKEENAKTIQELGLFDDKMPNKILKIFFNDYEKMFLKFNGDFFKQQYMENIQQCIILIQGKKNLILQGAPGTGKTYNTAALALSICGVKNGDIFNVSENGKDTPYTMDFSNHSVVMKRYEQLSYDSKNNPNGQIAFCTFHQSMDYEDFIEGIKPKTENGIISYNVEDGIFKILSTNANKITTEKKSSKIDFKKTRIFKMSLGKKGKDDEEIFSYCFENNVVALGWGENKDFSDCRTQKDFIAKYVNDSINKWGAVAMEIFKQQMKKGDIILVSNGTKAVKAIAKVVGEYEFHDDAPIDMCQFRKVEWLYTGEPIPITKLYNKNLSQQSIYAFYDSAKEGKIDFNSIKTNILNDIITGEINNETPQNYVLIIDEINRGNVSKIFGELITLLEADKRLGGEHPIKVTLPYSKDEFGVPSNLYIIGTMNTTDRSVGNIDYAVRRRFAFVTLKSKREIVEDKWGTDDCNAVKLFDAVKSFIEKKKYDMDIEDLMVGHSYFMANDDSELELKWKYEILPLLNEYIKDGILKGDAIKTDKTIDNFISENPNA